jgi:hypothetical protein
MIKPLILAGAVAALTAAGPAAPARVTPPDLFIANIYPGNVVATVRVCNDGTTAAPATYLRLEHFWSPWVWSNQSVQNIPTPAISGLSCINVVVTEGLEPDESNSYFAYADFFEEVTESNEGNNTLTVTT